MRTLRIALLGDFQLRYSDEPITTVNTPRLQALFTYLLLHRQAPQSRHHLAFQFWPDSSEKQAHTNLRKLLFQLRNALPDPDRFLSQDHLTVQWRLDAPYTLDVAELTQLLARCHHINGKPVALAQHEDLAGVLNLYQGELLPGCFDEWILPVRQQLHRDVMGALEQLANLAEHQREYRAGIRYAQRLLGLDPLHEAGYRRLMQLHALNGDRAAALHDYHTCVTILQQELGVEPDEETRTLYQHLLHMDGQPVPQPAPLVDAPLVGRATEWQTLLAAWRGVQRGQAHFVSVAGEAGMGKTRLAEELLSWTNAQGIRVARTRSYEAEGGLAYTPVTEWLRSDALKPALKKLEKPWLSEVARLLPELLTTDHTLTPPAPLTESWQRQRFFEALARATLAEKTPLLLFIDNLQWCDQETLTWLRFLLRYGSQTRLLVIGAWRSEAVDEQHPLRILLRDLGNTDQVTPLELTPLTQDETVTLAHHVAARPLTPLAMQQLYQATEGHPLFVVEMVRATLGDRRVEPGDGRQEIRGWRPETKEGRLARGAHMVAHNHQSPVSNLLSLSPKVQAVIRSRLAQLSSQARELAGLAATIGRQFRLPLLQQVGILDEDKLIQALDELWQQRIVREQGADAYDFSHDKIREMAYQDLSQIRRRFLHRRVAEALEQFYAHERSKVAGQLATHFEEAALPERAITYYQEAATAAFQIYALQEVNLFCQHGLRLLNDHPILRANVQRELKLLVMLTAVAAGVQGYGVEEIKALYERALNLSAKTEPGDWIVSIYYGLWVYYFVSAEFDQADRLTEQMPEQANRLNDPFLLELAHHGRGLTLLYRGAATLALAQLTQSLSFAQSRAAEGETFQQSQSLTMMTYAFRAIALWLLGYPDQARTSSQEALRRQAAQPTPLNQAAGLTVASVLHSFMRDKAAAFAYAQRALAICDQYELFYWRLFAMISHIWARFDESVDQDQEIDQFTLLLEQIIYTGNYAALAFNYRLLAEMQAQSGKLEAAIASLHKALMFGEKNDERWWEADNYRYLGELLLQMQQVDEAVVCLQKALVISQAQGIKPFELRAAMSLARFWHRQTQTKEAHTLLAPIYGWFSEGFDTPDLIEAKALLDILIIQD